MKKMLPILLFCCSISPLYSMEKNSSLLPLNASKKETVHLLSQDFYTKDIELLHMQDRSASDQLYISQDESESELTKLRELLQTKEQESASLSTSHQRNLRWLHKQCREEHTSSNATIGTLAFIYYFINLGTQLAGDPRLWEDKGKNWSILPFCANFFVGFGSEIYSLIQCWTPTQDNR